MLDLSIWVLVFVVSLVVLIKAADSFTISAEKIGLYFGLPAFIVGVTIVSIGTSLPELVSSIFAVLSNSSEIVVGNVVGSNIANILLVLAVAGIIGKRVHIEKKLLRVDLPLMVVSAFVLAITVWDGLFSLPEAFLCLLCLIIYLFYIIRKHRRSGPEIRKEMKSEIKVKRRFDWKALTFLIISTILIYLSAKYTIESVVRLSAMLNIGKEIVAASAIAIGTSLPELMVTVSAARRGKPEIAVGNIIGSNIFNSFAVMGVPALVGSLIIPPSILAFSLPVMLLATLLFFFISMDKEITRAEGIVLLIFYAFFIAKLFNVF
ncbi:MAG: calcium/sodium antiporter [bacterium]|nr:calcium/sodium antiporter [bacterium]